MSLCEGGLGVVLVSLNLDEARGIPALDVITDISPLNNVAAERLGYPTQKPEATSEVFSTAAADPHD